MYIPRQDCWLAAYIITQTERSVTAPEMGLTIITSTSFFVLCFTYSSNYRERHCFLGQLKGTSAEDIEFLFVCLLCAAHLALDSINIFHSSTAYIYLICILYMCVCVCVYSTAPSSKIYTSQLKKGKKKSFSFSYFFNSILIYIRQVFLTRCHSTKRGKKQSTNYIGNHIFFFFFFFLLLSNTRTEIAFYLVSRWQEVRQEIGEYTGIPCFFSFQSRKAKKKKNVDISIRMMAQC